MIHYKRKEKAIADFGTITDESELRTKLTEGGYTEDEIEELVPLILSGGKLEPEPEPEKFDLEKFVTVTDKEEEGVSTKEYENDSWKRYREIENSLTLSTNYDFYEFKAYGIFATVLNSAGLPQRAFKGLKFKSNTPIMKTRISYSNAKNMNDQIYNTTAEAPGSYFLLVKHVNI